MLNKLMVQDSTYIFLQNSHNTSVRSVMAGTRLLQDLKAL